MTEEVKTITFNDKQYDIDSISDKAKYFINQIQDLNTQGVQTRARLDQIEVAAKAFTDMLRIELETEVDDGND